MTAVIVLEKASDLDKKITLTNNDFKGLIEEDLVTSGFMANETVTYRDLLYGLLIKSGADCAKGLVNNIASEEEFVSFMNEKAKELKLKNTSFSNPIGLDNEKNYSTATDVSKLFMYALKNDDFKKILTADSYRTSNGHLTIKNNIRKSDCW